MNDDIHKYQPEQSDLASDWKDAINSGISKFHIYYVLQKVVIKEAEKQLGNIMHNKQKLWKLIANDVGNLNLVENERNGIKNYTCKEMSSYKK